ncbi:TIGR04141 family sporadically distributed protein [Chelativorans sp. M5D2P16]|uniref:TIGR04141 family sporadically distributed protein n=1 Tax=Chelativorans sp. M5D2P16 TaxID=3095678 RepID=UPI002ACA9824|nr:TIGR04141 family sporadically distributed protein [Chelativorans sp. M5D2P16]MDZ5696696.1 TIGR04141 family sporadically distributed protein [Chelativorans sp. M5D2P16]
MAMRTLNVRLVRIGRTIENAFTETFAPGAARALQEKPWEGIEGARVFVGQIYSNPPGWRTFIAEGFGEVPEGIFTGGAGAVIFVPVGDRMAAICFGHIHIALNDDVFERQFGLKVTLNTVPRSRLRTLDLATPDAVTFQKRVQASKDSDLQEFGVDMLRDLARVAGGTPTNTAFARFVAGKDSLSITCDVDAGTLQAKCTAIVDAYQKDDYRKEFAWVDNMKRVVEKDVVEELDGKLFDALQALRDGNQSDLHMAPPEIVNYTEGSQLHYNGFGSHGTTFYSLSIDDYVSELQRCDFEGDIAEIKEKHRIKAKGDGEEEFSEKWRVYDCFVFETSVGADQNARHYVMFAGSWYLVEKKFKDRIDNFFNEIEQVTLIGATTCRNEEELIENLVANRPDLLKLDQEKINPDGVRYANIEPCDFFSNNKKFIHLKDGHSSGPISHLWSQGVVSAEAFVSDAEFRKKLRSKVRSLGGGFEAHLPKSTDKLVREDYGVIYGIMRKPYADGSLGLPFFSKVSLQTAAERLAQFGIPLAIELIEKPAADAAEEPAEEAEAA